MDFITIKPILQEVLKGFFFKKKEKNITINNKMAKTT